MAKGKKFAQVCEECVACGACLKACNFNAIEIKNGVKAKISEEVCVGCGKCKMVCPANVIKMVARGEV